MNSDATDWRPTQSSSLSPSSSPQQRTSSPSFSPPPSSSSSSWDIDRQTSWTIESLIGEGVYGRVYAAAARDGGETTKAVVKISLNVDYTLELEYACLRRINGLLARWPHFPVAYELLYRTNDDTRHKNDDDDECVFEAQLYMSRVTNAKSLMRFIKDRRVDAKISLGVVFQTMAAIEALHRVCRLAHNDLTTCNVLVDRTDADVYVYNFDGGRRRVELPTYGYQPVVVDYGLAVADSSRPLSHWPLTTYSLIHLGVFPFHFERTRDVGLFVTSVNYALRHSDQFNPPTSATGKFCRAVASRWKCVVTHRFFPDWTFDDPHGDLWSLCTGCGGSRNETISTEIVDILLSKAPPEPDRRADSKTATELYASVVSDFDRFVDALVDADRREPAQFKRFVEHECDWHRSRLIVDDDDDDRLKYLLDTAQSIAVSFVRWLDEKASALIDAKTLRYGKTLATTTMLDELVRLQRATQLDAFVYADGDRVVTFDGDTGTSSAQTLSADEAETYNAESTSRRARM